MERIESTIRITAHAITGFIAGFGLACSLSVLLWNWLACLLACVLCWVFREELGAIGDKAGDYAVFGAGWLLNKYRGLKGSVIASADAQQAAV